MWWIIQGAIIFGVFCWIGQFIPLDEGYNARAAGTAGVLVALATTFVIVYVIDLCSGWLRRRQSKQPDFWSGEG